MNDYHPGKTELQKVIAAGLGLERKKVVCPIKKKGQVV